MAKRKIIRIIEEKCDGCGLCARGCPEGAIQIIDGKARLISDSLCDGLGACIGECPRGAIITEERQAEAYDEIKTLKNIIKQGPNTLKAHLKHLKDHGQKKYYDQAVKYLKEKNIKIPSLEGEKSSACGCPGSAAFSFEASASVKSYFSPSRLSQWPVQGHLVSPSAPYFNNSDLLVAADCCAFSYGNFHEDFIKGKSLFIACPKLDSELDIYKDKFIALIDEAKVKSIEVVTMEVPCCSGLLFLVKQALSEAERKPPLRHVVIGIKGDIKSKTDIKL